ncbi:MAG TPA: UDP-N-acetylmuramoyl-tripeptide--D-alanyl-D-alanine ligase [Deinococcales bacterium]|nr:UDP-N-acetylmuramoyl-tripeptide--D-alanyl-D-alanine ligase [Deinococcales bacterium]
MTGRPPLDHATGRPPLDPAELVALGLAAGVPADARPAARIAFDSREASPDCAFAALPGQAGHGRDFVAQALERGAPFVITDRPAPRAVLATDPVRALHGWATARRERFASRVTGITGSAGKTTAKAYAAATLEAGSPPGNLNTPHAIACHMLNTFAPGSREVLELGIDHMGEMAGLLALARPDVGVVTAIGAAHLDGLGNVETVACEKGLILEGRPGLVHEDAAGFYRERLGHGVQTSGFGAGADRRGRILPGGGEGVAFRYAGRVVRLDTPSLAVASAAVLALALAEDAGLDLDAAAVRVQAASAPGSRMRVRRGRFTLLDDAYNANPTSMRAAFQAAERFPRPRLAVLGDMKELGAEARARHEELGAAAAGVFDQVVCVGEFAPVVAGAARAGGAAATEAIDADAALSAVLPLLAPNCVVLVKGSHSVGLEAVSEALVHEL